MENIESLKEQIQTLKKEMELLKAEKNTTQNPYQNQEDSEESENRFRTIFETSRLGNKVITPDLKIRQVNQALVDLLGYDTKQEILGTRILDYAPLEFHSHWKLLQSKLWETKMSSFSLETCLRKKDGTVFWCQVTSILFDDQEETLGYTIIQDISDQREEKQQRENFISIASHELKTPLTSLQATFQLMERMIENDNVITDKLIRLSANAKRSILKLGALVGDLLDSTKISKGHLELDISTFNFSELVDKCCSHVRLEGKYNIIYKGDLSLTICADQQKIDQVLVNLVNNAVKYAPESLEIIVEVQQIDDLVKILVIDHGKGISQDKIPFLFDPYYQAKTGKDSTQGLGLGLYISAEIVKKHNGQIGVHSETGKGTTFWFTIPQNLEATS